MEGLFFGILKHFLSLSVSMRRVVPKPPYSTPSYQPLSDGDPRPFSDTVDNSFKKTQLSRINNNQDNEGVYETLAV